MTSEIAPQTPSGRHGLFDHLVNQLVTEIAPRLFAVVQEYGDHEDGRVAAWGLAFDDRVEVIGAEGSPRMSLRAPESALRFYRGDRITVRLKWLVVRGVVLNQNA
jgi:hypothetical protein